MNYRENILYTVADDEITTELHIDLPSNKWYNM